MTIRIVEVGPRDGLQNEPTALTPKQRADFVQKLIQAGVRYVEAGAFVSPKWVPQMAATADVFHILNADQPTGTTYAALTPNIKGLEAAAAAGVKEVAIFTAASESFTQKNINNTINGSLSIFSEICTAARSHNIQVRGYISCVVHCPYEGMIQPEKVIPLAEKLLELGCYQVSLGDTTGRATPAQIRALVALSNNSIPTHQIAGHFHDTFGQGLANVLTALELGITTFDTSVAGLGGCPYSPGASGNLATEDLIYMLEGLGFTTGINLQVLAQVGQWVSKLLNKQNQSKVGVALMQSS